MLARAEDTPRLTKEEYRAVVPGLRVDLVNAQYELRDAPFPVIVVVAGDDRLAANDVVNRLNEWMDARYMPTYVFGPLSPAEREHPEFRRLWMAMPPKGRVALWAGGLLRTVSAFIDGEITEDDLETWTRHLEALQAGVLADDAVGVKLFLHTPRKVQRRRLKEARRDPALGWRVDERDWRTVEQAPRARPLMEEMMRRTTAPASPWTVIDAGDARSRDVAAARAILDAITRRLEAGPPRVPAPRPAAAPRGRGALARVDLGRTIGRGAYRRRRDELQGRLNRLSVQAREAGVSTVLAFEGWDAAGKGGVIRRVTGALEAGDYRVIPTAAPSEEERAHHYLWRFWRDLPPAGTVAVFDRSWYGRVLVERVEGLATETEWRRAYREIADFEGHLLERGHVLLKFWLHISADEQLARFRARETTPYKKYKITDEDYRNRARWDDSAAAVDEMVRRTSTPQAPWHLVSSQDKRSARIEVLSTVVDALERALERR